MAVRREDHVKVLVRGEVKYNVLCGAQDNRTYVRNLSLLRVKRGKIFKMMKIFLTAVMKMQKEG